MCHFMLVFLPSPLFKPCPPTSSLTKSFSSKENKRHKTTTAAKLQKRPFATIPASAVRRSGTEIPEALAGTLGLGLARAPFPPSATPRGRRPLRPAVHDGIFPKGIHCTRVYAHKARSSPSKADTLLVFLKQKTDPGITFKEVSRH